jgi:adenylate cyclase
MSFFSELKRRNVFRVGVAYLLVSWVLLQVVDFVLDAISAPNWIVQVFILAAVVGLPVVLIFSWVFEMTPEGVKLERDIDRTQSIAPNTGRKLDRVIILFLVAAVAVLVADRFIGTHKGQIETSAQPDSAAVLTGQRIEASPAKEGEVESGVVSEKSIAVLPFVALSSGQDDEYFADGLTEEILNSLAQLPELLVTARTSAFYFKGKDIPIAEIAAKLGVGTIVEGSVRRAGERLRVTAQLIRAADGFHLWSENYDSNSEDTIAVQEDIAEKIATAMNVVLDEDKREAMRLAGLRDVEAFIAMQKGVELFEDAHNGADIVERLDEANRYFEQVQEKVPEYPLAHQLHSDAYIHRLMNGAEGQLGGATESAEVEEAMSRALADYELVLRYARTLQERNNAELDLAFITGDWRGMPARLERFAAERGCSAPSWMENIALPFGYAQLVEPRNREFNLCDPLASSTWRAEVRTQLWAGDPEGALQSAQKGSELAPGEWLSIQMVSALVALGRFEEADTVITARFQNEISSLSGRMMIAAAQGDLNRMTRLFDLFEKSPDPYATDFWELSYAAWAGERDRANRIAARVDEHKFGSQALATILLWCLCGPAWDLEATPNFAEKIGQSGLAWPPSSPINFPLKNW